MSESTSRNQIQPRNGLILQTRTLQTYSIWSKFQRARRPVRYTSLICYLVKGILTNDILHFTLWYLITIGYPLTDTAIIHLRYINKPTGTPTHNMISKSILGQGSLSRFFLGTDCFDCWAFVVLSSPLIIRHDLIIKSFDIIIWYLVIVLCENVYKTFNHKSNKPDWSRWVNPHDNHLLWTLSPTNLLPPRSLLVFPVTSSMSCSPHVFIVTEYDRSSSTPNASILVEKFLWNNPTFWKVWIWQQVWVL